MEAGRTVRFVAAAAPAFFFPAVPADEPRSPYFCGRVWLVIGIIALALLGIVLFLRFFPSDIGDQRSKSFNSLVASPAPTVA